MPCDTERTITTDLRAAHPDVLTRGLAAAGFTMTLLGDGRTVRIYDPQTGRNADLSGRQLSASSEAMLSEIKRAYAGEAVRTAARKYGWAVKVDAQADTFTVVRRTL